MLDWPRLAEARTPKSWNGCLIPMGPSSANDDTSGKYDGSYRPGTWHLPVKPGLHRSGAVDGLA